MKSRILVCGGRTYFDRFNFSAAMLQLRPWFAPKFCIIEGGAPGADTLARDWALENTVPLLEFPANWRNMGRSAGTIRNTWMLDFGLPDLVVAFPGAAGTANMVQQARARQIDVMEPFR
ncbi:Mycobacteriophage D29, Gp61 [uncultured Caudovirales phage]|uniref:Mycobacteriophage D29, Gp61 n=1 Tax=uncultured Caudovirales phage TaxID=2100421 RepID=A0A6J5RQ82_9CAUD|nr:Mycobacteriophage D29, Gp61 [uncultured Caudovirales phage]